MDLAARRIRLLDASLFWRKLALLVVFSALFLPLKAYELEMPLRVYIGFLLVLHVYFVFVLIWRVRWDVLAEHKRSFSLRILAVALFIAILALNESGASFWEFALFLAVSLVVHTGLLLSLTVVIRPPTPALSVAVSTGK